MEQESILLPFEFSLCICERKLVLFLLSKVKQSHFQGSQGQKVCEPALDQMKCRDEIRQPLQWNCSSASRGRERIRRGRRVISPTFLCFSWPLCLRVMVLWEPAWLHQRTPTNHCNCAVPKPWDWTMKYLKMPRFREGGLWQCNVKRETTEHL